MQIAPGPWLFLAKALLFTSHTSLPFTHLPFHALAHKADLLRTAACLRPTQHSMVWSGSAEIGETSIWCPTICVPYLMQTSFVVCLQAAVSEPQSLDRLLLVTAFSVSAYSGVKRTQKPCNAFLGETFEYSCPQKGFRFLAEKVSSLTLLPPNQDEP